jgi:hypothetical protein
VILLHFWLNSQCLTRNTDHGTQRAEPFAGNFARWAITADYGDRSEFDSKLLATEGG